MSFFTPFAFVKQASAGSTGVQISQTNLAFWYDISNPACYTSGETVNNLATAGGWNSLGTTSSAPSSTRSYSIQNGCITFTTAGSGNNLIYFDSQALPIGASGYTMWLFFRNNGSEYIRGQFFTANDSANNKTSNFLIDSTSFNNKLRWETGTGNPFLWPTIASPFPAADRWYFAYGDYSQNDAIFRLTVDSTTYTNSNVGLSAPYTPPDTDRGTTMGLYDSAGAHNFSIGACGFYTSKQSDAQMATIKTAYNNAGYYV